MTSSLPTPQQWNAIRREILARLKQEIAPFAHGGPIDYAAYRAACAETFASLARLTQDNLRYLARKFREGVKTEVCAFHHDWMQAHVAPSGLHALLEGRVTLWSKPAGGAVYSARMHVEQWVAREGELTLDMFIDEQSIFYVSFSVVPAAHFGLAGAALLISRLQGAKDRFDDLRRATKDLADVAPRAVLYAVLTGVARAGGIDCLAGVAAENFITYAPERHDELVRQYDDFFRAQDAEGPFNGFYLIDLRRPPKPVTEVKAGHRIRTRRKRALREEIASETAANWARLFALPPPAPSHYTLPPFSFVARLRRWRLLFG